MAKPQSNRNSDSIHCTVFHIVLYGIFLNVPHFYRLVGYDERNIFKNRHLRFSSGPCIAYLRKKYFIMTELSF